MQLTDIVADDHTSFLHQDDFDALLSEECRKATIAHDCIKIGTSEEGRPLFAFRVGAGEKRVCLAAGAHSDEPVGPETLRMFIQETLLNPDQFETLFEEYQFIILPHVNPDGEAKNWPWIKKWPNLKSYLKNVFREPPGRDIEFGYPDMREENRKISRFLSQQGPFHLYINFHGMAFSEGIMLLIEKSRFGDTDAIRQNFLEAASDYDLPLHDHDRKGEKGFQYFGPGFTSTPESEAMRKYFMEQGDTATAELFHRNSMEFVRSLGWDPLCLVTEFPLYIVNKKEATKSKPGVPEAYLEWKELLPELQRKLEQGKDIDEELRKYSIQPLPLNVAMKLQLRVLQSALREI